jgi:nuclear transport factor 2 (NTF2) superfamily protein
MVSRTRSAFERIRNLANAFAQRCWDRDRHHYRLVRRFEDGRPDDVQHLRAGYDLAL